MTASRIVFAVGASLVRAAAAHSATQPPATEPPAPEPPAPVALDRVEVSSTRLHGVDAFDTPASIVVVDLDDAGDRPGANVADALAGVPGVAARNRHNVAQDTQLSIRGFGARATFGVRGVRLYADGIPATMPDGQGQLSHWSLLAGDRIEVMRGPYSSLDGNSAGGVVRIESPDGADGLRALASASVSPVADAAGARLLGGNGAVGFNLAATSSDVKGWREHSAARRESFNAKVRIDTGRDGAIRLVANHYAAPRAQDPLGLSRADALAQPRRATPAALAFDTRKSTTQDQAGAVLDQPLGGGYAVHAMAYAGRRSIEQFLAVPVAAQASPLSAGGVVDLDGTYGGGDLRVSWHGEWLGGPLDMSAGLAADTQRQQRRGFENFLGATLGVRGALRRDERNLAGNTDRYAQVWWAFAPRWSLLAGARHSAVRFESVDRYVTAGNPDDGGRADYAKTTPMAALMFAPHERLRTWLSAGRGFETPTFNELGYRADGGAGLAFDLRPATSRSTELGARWRGTNGATIEAAAFRAMTDDELVVARNVGGRSSYRNAGRARRQGVEIAGTAPLGRGWEVAAAVTSLDATFRDGYATPAASVRAGARIPGTARVEFSGRLNWQSGGWSATAQAVAVGRITADDAGEASAPGHARVDVEAARAWPVGDGRPRVFARVDNAFDRRTIGSVIVNEGNGRYFEPGIDRTWTFGARWDWQRR